MKFRVLLLLVAVVAAAAVVGGAYVFDRWVSEPYRGWDGEHVDIAVAPGTAASSVADLLAEAGVVRDPRLFTAWLWWTERTGGIQAGEYRFRQSRSVREVADILVGGRVLLRPVTVAEGVTRWQVARAIEVAGFGGYEAALAATARTELIDDIDPEAADLEGYLYPETYMAPSSHGPDDLVEAMVDRFRDVWTPDRAARAAELGMSPREVVTLASIIEAETPVAEERPIVSGVFHNRLARGMRLQTDPTVIYAKLVLGNTDRTIYRSDLERDSPYNTYVIVGLPAGPIGNPRAASIDAALHPADVEFLYFVSRNDGTHVFSSTLAEHNRMVQQYQRRP